MPFKSSASRQQRRRGYFASFILLAAILSSSVTKGMGPDDEGDFETVDRYRHRMGIEYGYKMRVLSPELCRDYSERECQDMENSFTDQARKLRQLQFTESGHDINVVVLLLRFTNHADRTLPSPEDIHTLLNDPGKTGDITPTGSVKSYLAANSYNQLKINAFVSPSWVTAAGSESNCAGASRGVNDEFRTCLAPALDALEGNINWRDYDLNGDGVLDAVLVLHSGYASTQGGIDEDGVDPDNRIQSHARSSGPINNPWQSPSTNVLLGNHVISSVFRGVSGQQITRLNVISREFLHTLGAIGIYDRSFNTYGAGKFAVTPGHVSPWVKIQLGWLTPIEITQDGTYSAKPSLTTKDVYKISAPYPSGEYLLIENRPAIEWDAELGGGGGFVIWSIDDHISGNTGKEQQVVMMQADGKCDLENNVNFGDEGDFFVAGRILGPSGAVSTKSRRTGALTGMKISNFSPPNTAQGTFTIEGLAVESPTPSPTSAPVQDPVLVPAATTARVLQVPSICPLDQCCISAALDKCDALLAATTPQPDCECYNFCDGAFLGCCDKGGLCLLNCSLELVAGCSYETPTSSPITIPNPALTSGVPTPLSTMRPTALPTIAPTPVPTSASTLPPTGLSTTLSPTSLSTATTLPPTGPPTTLPPTSLPATLLPTSLSTATTLPPTGLPVTLPPTSLPTTLPPASLPATLPPTGLPATLPPTSLPTAVMLPPTSLPATLPPTGLPATLPPTSLPTTLPPTSLPTAVTLPPTSPPATLPPVTLPPTSLPATLPPTSLLATLPPTGLPATLPPTSLPSTLPPTSLPATLLPTSLSTATTLPPTGLPATLLPTSLSTATTLPSTGPPATLPPTSRPTTLPPTSLPATLPPTGLPATLPPTSLPTTLPPTRLSTATTLLPTGLSATLPPTSLPTTLPPTSLPATLLPTSLSTATTLPPTGLPATSPPTSLPATLPRTSLPVTQPPTGLPTTLPPTSLPATLPPTSLPVTQPPTGFPTMLPPTSLPATLPPTSLPVTLPATSLPATLPPTSPSTALPPTSLPTTLPPTSLPMTLPPTQVTDQVCNIAVNTDQCAPLVATFDPIQDCECYNFCDSAFLGCCAAAVEGNCLNPIICPSGILVAGCTMDKVPSAAPTNVPTIAPTQSPVLTVPEECLVNVSTEACFPLMADQPLQDECDCYNFCNGGELSCCKFGEPCDISCSGELVAGCVEPEPTCLVSVSTHQCSPLVAQQTPVTDCDCYNYCNYELVGCCPYGEFCPVLCQGNFVGGCEVEEPNAGLSPTPVPLPSTKTPTSKQPFFFWPDSFQVPTPVPTVSPTHRPTSEPTGIPTPQPTTKEPTPQEDGVTAKPGALASEQPFFFWP
jgi:M6 family metalloprotease-like protein